MLNNPWKQDGKRRSPGLMQDAYLPELKVARPWYKTIHSNVLQMLVKRRSVAGGSFPKAFLLVRCGNGRVLQTR